MLLSDLTGYHANRRIFEGGTNIDDEIEGARGLLPMPSFQIAVVVDIYSDPSTIDPETLKDLELGSSTPELAKRMPKNSIVARVITRNQDLYDSSPRIFFPTNIFNAEPIKPGEQVFVFFVDPIINDQIGYWWKRVPQPIDTDDLNFTHADRKYQINEVFSSTDKLAGTQPGPPDFINGGETSEQQTLSGKNDYENINKNAKANSQIVKEPVARFTKRPGDMVLMGSNAARIVLGMDRAQPAPAPATLAPKPKSATIDMVVGYGRIGTPTSPTTVVNSRGDEEVDKNLQTPSNPLEGDPDMINDPARLYLSENTDADTNFTVVVPGVPPSPGPAPSAVIKTNRIRLLANGDIKIVGNNNSIILDQIGNISLIGAPRINLGSAAAPHPIVHGPALLAALNTYAATITAATTTLNAAAQTYFGIPVPTPPQQLAFQNAWTAFNSAIVSAQSALSTALANSISTKVFSD